MATAEPKPAQAGWTVLQVRRTFPASRERVFRAWVDPDQLCQWLTGRLVGARHLPPAVLHTAKSPGAEVDPRVGGEFRVAMKTATMRLLGRLPGPYTDRLYMVGRYVEIDPPQRLVFTMGWEGMPTVHMDREASQVTVEFHEQGDQTEVVLTHERQPNRRIRAFHKLGWTASLRNLERVLKGGASPG